MGTMAPTAQTKPPVTQQCPGVDLQRVSAVLAHADFKALRALQEVGTALSAAGVNSSVFTPILNPFYKPAENALNALLVAHGFKELEISAATLVSTGLNRLS